MLTRNKNYEAKGAVVVHSIEELMEELKNYAAEDVYVAGERVFTGCCFLTVM